MNDICQEEYVVNWNLFDPYHPDNPYCSCSQNGLIITHEPSDSDNEGYTSNEGYSSQGYSSGFSDCSSDMSSSSIADDELTQNVFVLSRQTACKIYSFIAPRKSKD